MDESESDAGKNSTFLCMFHCCCLLEPKQESLVVKSIKMILFISFSLRNFSEEKATEMLHEFMIF